MKTIKISRANFPNTSMLYWATYFEYILSKKFNVVIDADDPDIVFFSNMFVSTDHIDTFTGKNGKTHTDYSSKTKKIFCTGEDFSNYESIISRGTDYYAIGTSALDHPRYLRLQLHNPTASWGLYDESKLTETPFDWLTQKRSGKEILNKKTHFCGVVQNSTVPVRVELFEKLSAHRFVRASGGWLTNVPLEERTIAYPRTDGEGYRSKVEFLSTCKFSLQVQSSNTSHFTHEKMIQAYAANTVPIFFGNDKILEDGFNQKSFINCHDYTSIDEVVERIKIVDQNDELFASMIEEPVFLNNQLPYYFNPDYLNSFIERVLNE